jgi:hypothetical protein
MNVLAILSKNKSKLRGFYPPANYTDQATAACRRSWCQLSIWLNFRNDVRFAMPLLLSFSINQNTELFYLNSSFL